MADIKKAMGLLYEVEFSSMPQRFLHKNKTENYLTLGGVSQKANPYNVDWVFIESILRNCGNAITRASTMLYNDDSLRSQIETIFLNKYWSRMKLNEINSQLIANEMFLFGVVAGYKNGAKLAQKLAGVAEDGLIGNISISAINKLDETEFSRKYDELEKSYFQRIINNNEKLAIYEKGWYKRADFV